MPGTTPKARAIGAELRRAREDAGLSARQLAVKLGKSHTTIGRWETGDRVPKPVDVATVLCALGASNELREELVDLARNSDGRHWSAAGLPEQQRQLAALLDIEREASRITTVSPLLVPGLLQTADYARAIMTAADVPRDEIDMRVAVRVGRREALTRRNPAELRAVVGESVLGHLIGGAEVMVSQLRALASYAELPNVDLRVVPTRTGWHPGLEGPFSVTEFAGDSPVVHIENRRSGQFFHEPVDVDAYRDAADKVLTAAMSSADSSALIADVINRMETRS